MARRRLTHVRNKWTPGLVTSRPPSSLVEGEAPVAKNVIYDHSSLKRRPGWLLEGSRPDPITGIIEYYPTLASASLLVIAGTSLLRTDHPVGSAWTTITSTLLDPADLPARPIMVPLGASYTFIALSKGPAHSIAPPGQQISSHSTIDGFVQAVPGSPISTILAQYNNSLWAAGDVANSGSRLRWSGIVGISGPLVWPALNFVDIGTGDLGRITGLIGLSNMLLVFKKNKVVRITGDQPDDAALDDGTLTVVELPDTPGCVAPRTVISNGELVIWLNERGLFSYNGGSLNEITKDVKELFRRGYAPEPNIFRADDAQDAWAAFISRNEFVCFYPATNDSGVAVMKGLYVSLSPFGIAEWVGDEGLQATAARYVAEKFNEVHIGFADGKLGRLSPSAKDGEHNIVWRYRTGELAIGPAREKKITRIAQIQASPTSENITIQALADTKTNDTKGKATPDFSLQAGENKRVVTRRANLTNIGRTFELEFSGDGSDTVTSPEIHAINLEYDGKSL